MPKTRFSPAWWSRSATSRTTASRYVGSKGATSARRRRPPSGSTGTRHSFPRSVQVACTSKTRGEAAMKQPRSKQEELERLGRALRTVSGSNRALLRADDEPSLLREICRVVVEEGGYYSALVGRAEHDERKTITPLAMVGDKTGLPEPSPFTWA